MGNLLKILLVDDEEDILEALSFNLEASGFDVSTAKSGNEAFEMFSNEQFDTVLTDIKMPDGNGIELLKKIKIEQPLFPVVSFITGYSDLSLREAFHLGANSTFPKPFSFYELKNKIEWAAKPLEQKWSSSLATGASFVLEDRENCPIGSGGVCLYFDSKDEDSLTLSAPLRLQFESSLGPIDGEGWIRWKSENENLIGVEFGFLEPESLDKVKSYIDKQKPRPYIPGEKSF